jgi:cation/acetate symporter
LLSLLPPLLGGMRGVTVTALVQFVVALVGLVAVSVWMSAAVTGSSLPPIAYATALMQTPGAMSGAARAIWNDAGLTLSIALGVACFPALLIRSATARSSASARSSIAWALLLVAVFCGCAATIAAVAKFALDATARQAGSAAALFDAAPWIADWADKGAGLVTICGQSAKDAVAAIAACGSNLVGASDLAIDPDIAMLAAPGIAGLPQFASMLLAAGCLVCTLAAASLVLYTIGASLGHDIYFRGAEPRAPKSRRLLAQRLSLLAATGLAAYVAANPPADYLQLALWSFSLAAAGLFPALVLAVWWKRANRWGALAGMIAGLIVAAYPIAADAFYPQLYFYLEQAGLADGVRGLGSNGIAAVAVPVGFVVAIIVSFVTRRPGVAQRQFAEALARPRDFPVDERE